MRASWKFISARVHDLKRIGRLRGCAILTRPYGIVTAANSHIMVKQSFDTCSSHLSGCLRLMMQHFLKFENGKLHARPRCPNGSIKCASPSEFFALGLSEKNASEDPGLTSSAYRHASPPRSRRLQKNQKLLITAQLQPERIAADRVI